MSITATELKNNLGKYLLLSAKEDVFITKNGKVVAKLTNPHQDRVEVAKSLFGILPKDADLNEAKEERLATKSDKGVISTTMHDIFTSIVSMKISVPAIVAIPVKSCVKPIRSPSENVSTSAMIRLTISPCE